MKDSIWNIWFIFGLIFAVIGVFILIKQYVFHKQCTEQTQGNIGISYQFGIPYMTLNFAINGEEYTKPLSGSNNFSEGQAVSVAYNPSNIKQYYIVEDKSNSMIVGIALTIGGIIFMLIGYGLYTGFFPESQVRSVFRKK